MKRMYTIGLCLMAVVAFSAVAAGSAFAEPEFTKPSNGAFPQSFTSEGGVGKLSSTNHEIECKTTLDLGKILAQPSTTSSMLGDIHFLFHGCKEPKTSANCQSSGQPTGLIQTPLYLWHLGTLMTAPNGQKAVLIVILVVNTEFECKFLFVTETVKVSGNLVGLILEKNAAGENQLNNSRSTIEVEFKQTSNGVQELKEAQLTLPSENKTGLELKSKVGGGAEENASEEASGIEKLAGTETVELKA